MPVLVIQQSENNTVVNLSAFPFIPFVRWVELGLQGNVLIKINSTWKADNLEYD